MLVSSFLSRRDGLVPPTLMSKGASLDKVNFGQFPCLPMHVFSNLHKPRIGKKKSSMLSNKNLLQVSYLLTKIKVIFYLKKE